MTSIFSNFILCMPRGPQYVVKVTHLFVCWIFNKVKYLSLSMKCLTWYIIFGEEVISINYSIDQVFDFRLSCVYITYVYIKEKSIKVGNKKYCKTNNFMCALKNAEIIWERVFAVRCLELIKKYLYGGAENRFIYKLYGTSPINLWNGPVNGPILWSLKGNESFCCCLRVHYYFARVFYYFRIFNNSSNPTVLNAES